MRTCLALMALALVLWGCGGSSAADTELPAKAKLPSGTEIMVSGNTRKMGAKSRVCGELRGGAVTGSQRSSAVVSQYCLNPSGPRGAEGHMYSSSGTRDDIRVVLVLPDRGYTARFVGRQTSRDAALVARPKGDSHAVVAVVAFAPRDLPGKVIVTSDDKPTLISDEISAADCPSQGGATWYCDSQIELAPSRG